MVFVVPIGLTAWDRTCLCRGRFSPELSRAHRALGGRSHERHRAHLTLRLEVTRAWTYPPSSSTGTPPTSRRLPRSAARPLPDDLGREIIVVDNGSTDGSADLVRANWPRCGAGGQRRNEGYQRANNRAIRAATGVICCSSTPTPRSDQARSTRCSTVLEDDRAAVVGPRLVYGDGSWQRWTAGHAPGPRVDRELLPLRRAVQRVPPAQPLPRDDVHEPFCPDWVSSACMLVRRDGARRGRPDGRALLLLHGRRRSLPARSATPAGMCGTTRRRGGASDGSAEQRAPDRRECRRLRSATSTTTSRAAMARRPARWLARCRSWATGAEPSPTGRSLLRPGDGNRRRAATTFVTPCCTQRGHV